MADKLIPLMYQSWADLDAAVAGLEPLEGTERFAGASSIAWTVGHVTNMVDSWLNVRFQGLRPHPLISDDDFRSGGSGAANEWTPVLDGVREVRASARRLLEARPPPELDESIAYDGSIKHLRPVGLSLRYALMRIAAHHFVHAGEIAAVRSSLGHEVADPEDWGRTLV